MARVMEECGRSSLNFMVGMKEEAHFPGGRRECAGQTEEQMSCMSLPSTPPGSLQNMGPHPRPMEQHLHLNRQPGDCFHIHIRGALLYPLLLQHYLKNYSVQRIWKGLAGRILKAGQAATPSQATEQEAYVRVSWSLSVL